MLTGFNTNVRYRGVIFHVQTEDSGRNNPHIKTHLFHGGNILASEKLEYADILESADLENDVRVLMEGLHKSMLRRLKRGEVINLPASALARRRPAHHSTPGVSARSGFHLNVGCA